MSENFTFCKFACHTGGSSAEPIAIFMEKRTRAGQFSIMDEFYCYPRCGMIERYQTDNIHGYETRPGQNLYNVGKIILVILFFYL